MSDTAIPAAQIEPLTNGRGWLPFYLFYHQFIIALTSPSLAPLPLGARQIAKTAEKLAREKELAKVGIRKEDVDLIADEMEIRD